ncbi:MAG TPA: TolC family protein [Burkholderiales bacterium]|nr:TolC family protein [Burkholderiales bacterium]
MQSSTFPLAQACSAVSQYSKAALPTIVAQFCGNAVLIFFATILVALCADLVLVPGEALADEAPLSIQEAQRRAVERSRQIAAQNASVTASREMAVAAGQLPDPVLRFGIDNLPINGPDQFSVTNDFMTMRRVGVMQEFTRSDKRELRAQRFENEAEKSLAEKEAVIASIQRESALAWLDVYFAEAQAKVIAQQNAQAKIEITAAEAAYRAGRGSQADVFAAHSARATLEDQASEVGRRVANARTMLARWVGDEPAFSISEKPAMDSIRVDSSTLDMELGHHPQIAILTKREQIAATEVRLAQADRKADWSVELSYSLRGPAYSNMVSIGVSVPLQWDQRNRQERQIASKLAAAEQARAEREEVLRAHVSEVRTMIAEWQNGRERVARYERELLPLALERTKAARAAYQGGKSTLTELLLARRNEIDVRMQKVRFEAETARLWAGLNFLFPDFASPSNANDGASK